MSPIHSQLNSRECQPLAIQEFRGTLSRFAFFLSLPLDDPFYRSPLRPVSLSALLSLALSPSRLCSRDSREQVARTRNERDPGTTTSVSAAGLNDNRVGIAARERCYLYNARTQSP